MNLTRAPSRKYLTKSRFKLALSCPTKLFYNDKPEQFANTQADNAFMQALAEGGFQVGELAKLMYPEGVEVSAKANAEALAQTQALLQAHTVTLFEAAIAQGDYLVRVDILRKIGDVIDLIEVKAKSFDSRNVHAFRGKQGQLDAGMLPYLQDVAFQKHVIAMAHPAWQIRSHLMLADTALRCSVSGLNQRFKIRSAPGGRHEVWVAPGTTPDTLGDPVLTAVCVDEWVDEILAGCLTTDLGDLPFAQAVQHWANHVVADTRIPARIGARCAKCEFRCDPGRLESGFHLCWQEAEGWTREEVDRGTVLDLWNFPRKQALIDQGVLRLQDVTPEHLHLRSEGPGLSNSQRQWMQVSGKWPEGGEYHIDRAFMREAMRHWRYPLHFIDFETARVAIPFFAGQRPYANVAFQFSHHVMEASGAVRHADQFLNLTPGVNPNVAFVRALKSALEKDEGTVFMWSPHENTTLLDLLREIESGGERVEDAQELAAFIRTLTVEKEKGRVVRAGERAMVDLCVLARKAYFHPQTQGSCSIKKVLPAVMASSTFLRAQYGRPIYGAEGGIPSLNFTDWTWWEAEGHGARNPYELLPPLFDDISKEEQDRLEAEEGLLLADGGAATMAWARMQFEDTPSWKREAVEKALLRYCELDTLAMVIVCQFYMDEK